ncbi:MAG: hypothetical protein JO337_02410 [Acidimicrobiales bacterium]|nr:hypothetical protein [Acidimicrobiales bacterium]
MHPIEHLRHVARAGGADPGVVAREAAHALAEMALVEPAGLVPACRRLIERHVAAGPVWWLSARLLRSDDPARAARQAGRELEEDPTADHLADRLPDEATVVVIGWPEMAALGLRSRGDVEVLVVDWSGEGEYFARRLHDRGSYAVVVPESGVGPAAAVADVVLVEALAAGPGGVVATPGSMAAAAVAAYQQVPVWAVVGVGRLLPEELWDALVSRLDESGDEPWDRAVQVVPSGMLTQVVGPTGFGEPAEMLAAPTCPAAPELFRPAG